MTLRHCAAVARTADGGQEVIFYTGSCHKLSECPRFASSLVAQVDLTEKPQGDFIECLTLMFMMFIFKNTSKTASSAVGRSGVLTD